jgi:hypothetical protein
MFRPGANLRPAAARNPTLLEHESQITSQTFSAATKKPERIHKIRNAKHSLKMGFQNAKLKFLKELQFIKSVAQS